MGNHALVLGGGGPVGIAWESGLLAGLAEAGLDLSNAAFIVGTSAGSVVSAQLAMTRAPVALAGPFLSSDPAQQPSSPSQLLGSAPPDLSPIFQKMTQAMSGAIPAEQARADIGAWALQAKTITEDAFIGSFVPAIRDYPEGTWPDRFACTAVDTADGSFMLWNRESGVSLARAVAFGFNLMDYTRRPAAAKAGYEQGKAAAAKLQLLWRAA